MSLSHSPKVVTDGLMLYLDAANKRSYPGTGATWSDLAGTNNGTLNNMEDNFDPAGKGSLTFDGTDEYVELGTSITRYFVDITISLWVYPLISSGTQYLASKYTYPNGWFIYYSGNKFCIDGRVSAQQYITNTSSDTYAINNWYNVVFTRSTSNWRLYVNSILQADNIWNNGTSQFTTDASFYIAKLNAVESQLIVSDIKGYNRALTGDEVRQNYLATRGRYK